MYHPDIHRRKSIRLKHYDYSSTGAYFVTIGTKNRECLFGEVSNEKMELNEFGQITTDFWQEIPKHFSGVKIDEFVVMPNHVHGILFIVGTTVGAKNFSPLPPTGRPLGTSKTIGSIIRGFKIGVTKWMRQNNVIHDVWQRNYYEHIIRNEKELNQIREYMQNNPLKWHLDWKNPQRTGIEPLEDEIFGNTT